MAGIAEVSLIGRKRQKARQGFCLGFVVGAGMAGGFEGWRLALETVAGAEAAGASALTDFTVDTFAFAFVEDLIGVSSFTADFWGVVVLVFATDRVGAFVLAFVEAFGAARVVVLGTTDANFGSDGAGLVTVFEAGAAALVLAVVIDLARGLRLGAVFLTGALVTAGIGLAVSKGASMVLTSARFMAWVMRIWRSTMRDIKK